MSFFCSSEGIDDDDEASRDSTTATASPIPKIVTTPIKEDFSREEDLWGEEAQVYSCRRTLGGAVEPKPRLAPVIRVFGSINRSINQCIIYIPISKAEATKVLNMKPDLLDSIFLEHSHYGIKVFSSAAAFVKTISVSCRTCRKPAEEPLSHRKTSFSGVLPGSPLTLEHFCYKKLHHHFFTQDDIPNKSFCHK